MSSSPHWIFGYGSLVWRPAFDHVERAPAFIQGWVRRFWQGSTDHRGRPEAPGRVVTLVAAEDEGASGPAEAACWGMAYRVEPSRLEVVLEQLDFREQGGYERLDVPVRLVPTDAPEREVRGIVYIATAANDNYLGPAPIGDITRQIMRSEGPSGPNPEYVTRLAEALRSIGAHDTHVFELDQRVRAGLAFGDQASGLGGSGRRDET